jgi:hypothetical protein
MPETVLYLILSHDNPEQVARLARFLRSADPECRVAIHHDRARSTLDGQGLEQDENVDVLSFASGIEWGGFGMVDAVLRSIEWLREHREFGWLVTLSGQDYPVRHPLETRRKLFDGPHDAYVTIYHEVPERAGAEPRERWWSARYFHRFYRLPAPPPRVRLPTRAMEVRVGLQRRISLAQPYVFVWSLPGRGGTFVGVRRRQPFGPGFTCYGGSQWFAASAKAVDVMLDFIRERPKVLAHYRRTMIADESFFNSILMNAPGLDVGQPNLGYWRLDASGNRGEVFRLGDLDELLATGAHFARKLDTRVDAQLLDELDRRLTAARPN